MRASVVIALLLAAGDGRAAEAMLLPSGPLASDGVGVVELHVFVVEGGRALSGAADISATRGAVLDSSPATDGGWLIHYRPPKVTASSTDNLVIKLGKLGYQVTLALEPAGRPTLELRVNPDPLVLGRGQTAEVVFRLRDGNGRPLAGDLRVSSNIGRVSTPVASGSGDWRAVFTPPDDRFPQVALIAAAATTASGTVFSAVSLRLAARINATGAGEAGAKMVIAVDGKQFGPTEIGADGRFSLPIVVPPGGKAMGTSTDALGNVAKREIDLGLPPFPRLALVALPGELPADGRARAEIVAFSVDHRGQPERDKPPVVTADRGKVATAQPRGDGGWGFALTAPRGRSGGGVIHVKARSPGGEGALKIPLRPAPPFRIVLDGPPPALPAGLEAPTEVGLRVEDGAGDPVTGAALDAALAGGRVVAVRERGAGRYTVDVVPPRDPTRTATLHAELRALQAGQARRMSLRWVRGAVEAWVDDEVGVAVPGLDVTINGAGAPMRATTDRYGVAHFEVKPQKSMRLVASARELVATLDLLPLTDGVRAVSARPGRGIVEDDVAPPSAALDANLPAVPAAPVELAVGRSDGGEPVMKRGQAVKVRVQLSDEKGVRGGDILVELSRGEIVAPPAKRGEGPRNRRLQVAKDGKLEMTIAPPGDARPGDRVLLSATEARSRVTVFIDLEVVK
jgi:hypothetical protein